MERHKIGGNVEDYCLVIQKNERCPDYKIVTEKDKTDMHNDTKHTAHECDWPHS